MEYKKITVVDEYDNFIGYVSYDEAVEKQMIRRASVVFIFNEFGELLVQKRSAHISKPLLLDKSVGGHVDEGETCYQTARREMYEELGLKDIELDEIVSSYRNESFFDAVYKAVIPKDMIITIDPHEVDSVYWMDILSLEKKMLTEAKLFTTSFIAVWHALRDKLLVA